MLRVRTPNQLFKQHQLYEYKTALKIQILIRTSLLLVIGAVFLVFLQNPFLNDLISKVITVSVVMFYLSLEISVFKRKLEEVRDPEIPAKVVMGTDPTIAGKIREKWAAEFDEIDKAEARDKRP